MTEEIKLPPLPARWAVLPKLVLPEVHGMGGGTTVFRQEDAFTADQMRAYARQAVQEAVQAELEDVAQIVESACSGLDERSVNWTQEEHMMWEIVSGLANAIRERAAIRGATRD